MNGAPLELRRDLVQGVDVIRLAGEADLSNSGEIERALLATASEVVVLELSALDYVDSAGIRAIDRSAGRLSGQGRSLILVAAPGSRVAWTFRVAGFGDGIVESLDEALAAAAARAGS